MPRQKNVIPSVFCAVRIPADLHTQLTLHLFSEVENRVPQGKWQEWFSARIREFFRNRVLDLAPFMRDAQPGVYMVSGPPEAIEMLKRVLKGEV